MRCGKSASAWAQHMGARVDDYGKSTYLFNGDFESVPAQSPFDWNVARTESVEVIRDCTTAWSGKCSLRISFAGTQNLGFAAASQLAFVRPGIYRFHAFIRTEVLTMDQGIRFQISDAEEPARRGPAVAAVARSGTVKDVSPHRRRSLSSAVHL